MEKLGPKAAGEDASKSLLRGLFVSNLCKAGHQKTIDFALAEMDKLFNDPKYKLDVDLVEAIYRAYASNGKDSFNKLMKLHSDADMMEEKNRLERSISSVKSSEDFEKVLDFILSTEVRDQDKAFDLLAAARTGKLGRERLLKLTYDKIDYFETVFGGMTIGRYINGLISMFQSQSKYDEISDFFKKHPIKQAERSISQGLEKIKTTSALVERDGDAIKQFFN